MYRNMLLSSGLLLLAACTGGPQVAAIPVVEPEPAHCQAAEAYAGPGVVRNDAIAALAVAERHQLALDLVVCLEDPDPEIRDGFAYETYVTLMRGNMLDTDTLRTLKGELLAALASADTDSGGFRGPFAALALSEVARTDRIEAWMGEGERTALVAAASDYLMTITDYRGFSDAEGWRHGVAHTADLMMQLSLNDQLTRAQADTILAAIAGKAATADHAYVFGEPARLATPLFYLARRGFYSQEEWDAWFGELWPADDPLRIDTYKSEAALRRLHNLNAFADAVYVNAVASDSEAFAPLAQGAFGLIRSLP